MLVAKGKVYFADRAVNQNTGAIFHCEFSKKMLLCYSNQRDPEIGEDSLL
ncbi:MAG: hypothetical protein WCD47_18745 [Candidatus Sulfotelmatobacter sp.]